MWFFTGKHKCKMDAKGRLALPSKIKSKLPETYDNQFILSFGLDPCLVLYPMDEFKKVYSRISTMNEFDEENRKLQRIFLSRINEVELDSAGRLLIPKHMSEFANLEKEIMVLGLINRIEIWDTSKYEKYDISDNSEVSKLAQKHLTK